MSTRTLTSPQGVSGVLAHRLEVRQFGARSSENSSIEHPGVTTRPDALDPEGQQNTGHRSAEIRKEIDAELSARQEGDYTV